MWRIDNIELAPVEMDFSESGQSVWSGQQAHVDGEQLVNAVELVDWQDRPVQVHVCETCGISGCARGGYVSLRRAGDFVVLMPAFPAMLESRSAREEYVPPDYLTRRGVVLLSTGAYNQLQSVSRSPRALTDIGPFVAKDAARVLQMEAPSRLLHEFPRDVELTDLDLGVPELWSAHSPELDEAVGLLESTLEAWRDSTAPVRLERERKDSVPLVFVLDWPPTYEWKPLVFEQPGVALRLDGGWVAFLD